MKGSLWCFTFKHHTRCIMKQNLIPYNDIWASCIHNMILTLLQYSGGNTNIIYKNDYEYNFKKSKTDDCEVYRISFGKEIIELNKFAKITYSDMVYSDEKFIQKVKEYIADDNCFVAINVDLFDWFPEGICYHQYHWNHYTLLTDYIEDNDMFQVFDEANGIYKKTEISSKKICECILRNEKNCIIFIEINKYNYIPKFTLNEVLINAKKLILKIETKNNITFYNMSEQSYDANWFRDLDAMHLMRIKERQKANAKLMYMLNNVLNENTLCECEATFRKLALQWNIIRLQLIKLYMKKEKRKENCNILNELIHTCFDMEKLSWEKVVQILEPISNNERVNDLFDQLVRNMK